ncbi:MAG: T9SS type A sorting domain-containing protein, partial [Bacteroidota bacterium]
MKKIIFVFLFGICCLNTQAQINPPVIQWQNDIGGVGNEWFSTMTQTNDGGFLIGGYSSSILSGDKTENSVGSRDYWVLKINSYGNIIWQNDIGGSLYDGLFSVDETTDGGYILGGSSDSHISGDKTEDVIGVTDYWVIKLDSLGNVQWQNTIGGNDADELFSINQTTDGGYIIGGSSASNISGDKTEDIVGGTVSTYDYWIVKLNSAGVVQWDKTIGGNDNDVLYSIEQTQDGGYILGGTSYSNASGNKTENVIGGVGDADYWIVKVDSTGGFQWDNTIGGTSGESLFNIFQTPDGGYIMGGSSTSDSSGDKTENRFGTNINYSDYWILKLNSAGNIQWQRTIGGDSSDVVYSISPTINNKILVAEISLSGISGNKTEANFGSNDFWVLELSSNGNILWQKEIGGDNYDVVGDIIPTTEYGVLVGGFSFSGISGNKTDDNVNQNYQTSDYWIIKLAPDSIYENSVCCLLIDNSVSISPNPATNEIKITNLSCTASCGPTENQISIFNLLGQQVLYRVANPPWRIGNSNNATINVFDFPAGIYVVTIFDGEKIVCK